MLKDVLLDPGKSFASAEQAPRVFQSILTATAVMLIDGFIAAFLLWYLGLRPVSISTETFGVVEVTRGLALGVYAWGAFLRLIAYPLTFHGVAILLGARARLSVGFETHSRLTSSIFLVHLIGSTLALVWPMSLVWKLSASVWGAWQIFVGAWGVWLHVRLARGVYGLSAGSAVFSIIVSVALTVLQYAAVLTTLPGFPGRN